MADLGLFKSSVALGAVAFTGYCIYFDYKRRTAPDYKEKIREKRRAKENAGISGGGRMRSAPSPRDSAGMQAFFMEEMQLGEELLSRNLVEEGAEHISNAVVMCGQGRQLLQILQQTLPHDQFEAVVGELPAAEMRMKKFLGGGDAVIEEIEEVTEQLQEMVDDDLE